MSVPPWLVAAVIVAAVLGALALLGVTVACRRSDGLCASPRSSCPCAKLSALSLRHRRRRCSTPSVFVVNDTAATGVTVLPGERPADTTVTLNRYERWSSAGRICPARISAADNEAFVFNEYEMDRQPSVNAQSLDSDEISNNNNNNNNNESKKAEAAGAGGIVIWVGGEHADIPEETEPPASLCSSSATPHFVRVASLRRDIAEAIATDRVRERTVSVGRTTTAAGADSHALAVGTPESDAGSTGDLVMIAKARSAV